ncbi:MAG: amidohydrolase [Chloroflexi bacterium]|nr:amidohydrolase [Chloroflexota bacterium]
MLILHNARIYTLNPQRPTATALAIEQRSDCSSRILALRNVEALQQEFSKAKLEDLEGRVVLPGLTDAHLHLRQYALMLQALDCRTATRAECLERVAARATQTPPSAWILGHGWQQNDWPEGFGTAFQLDAAAPRNPVFLTAASLHAAWVNSAALKAAGITTETPDPPNGRIQRNSDGTPTGILFEAALGLITAFLPEPSPEDNVQAIQNAESKLWSFGLTSVHDFDRSDCFRALQTLRERDELKLRALKSIPIEDLEHVLAIGLHSGFGDDLLRVGAVKVFADGALGPRTAAMFEPYEGEPQNRGMLFVDSEQLLEWGQQAVKGGLGMAVHAIGDRANHEVLNAFEQIRSFEQTNYLTPRRHRIEHVQVLHPDDVDRLGQLGLIASMQPIHATSDMEAADKYWGERAPYSYGWKTQLEAGAVLAFGSDAPVESPNPWLGIHAAVTRRRADGSPGDAGWIPEQRLSLQEALGAFTYGAARSAGMENRLGRLSPGYLADLIVVNEDPFSVAPHDLQHIKLLATMVGGHWVWRS